MAKQTSGIFKQGVAFSAALVVSGVVLAQAPVYDVEASSDLEKRLEVLERVVKSRTEMQHRIQQQLDTMQGEIDQLRGAVEVNTNELQKVLERQRELYLEIDKRVEALKQASPPAQTPVTTTTTTPSVSSVPSAPAEGENEAYENAVNLILKSREYDKAIPAFQSFISRFPNSEFADNAHYWLGQLLFNKQQWEDSRQQFTEVVSRFTSSSKRPDAILKLGVIAERLGDMPEARRLFEQVISEYPQSSASQLASARLSGN